MITKPPADFNALPPAVQIEGFETDTLERRQLVVLPRASASTPASFEVVVARGNTHTSLDLMLHRDGKRPIHLRLWFNEVEALGGVLSRYFEVAHDRKRNPGRPADPPFRARRAEVPASHHRAREVEITTTMNGAAKR